MKENPENLKNGKKNAEIQPLSNSLTENQTLLAGTTFPIIYNDERTFDSFLNKNSPFNPDHQSITLVINLRFYTLQ